MGLDPIFKVIRAVKGGGERRCPKCRKETLVVVEKTDEKRTGVICRECGWGRLDLKSERYEISCEAGCNGKMGSLELVEGAEKKKYICPGCAQKRRDKKVEPDPETILVRYASRCTGGCGNIQMWIDFPEGSAPPPPEKLRSGYCRACAAKVKPAMLKNNSEEKLIRETVEELKKKQAAGQPVSQADMLSLVDRLLKLRGPR